MRNKIFKLIIIIGICIILMFLIIIFINSKKFYFDAIDSIKVKYDNIIGKDNAFLNDNYYFSANLKTEHTSNLVHSINQVFEKNYDFIIKKDDGYIYIYLDDKFSKISIDGFNNIFDINKINNCIYLDKERVILNEKSLDVNKYNYLCDSYEFSIYTSRIFNKYIKSEIIYDDVSIEFKNNSVNYKNGLLSLNFYNIRNDNYILNFNYDNKKFDIFYTYNNYDKYSFIYNSSKVSLIMDDPVILLINCDTRRYSRLKLSLNKMDIDYKEKYDQIKIDELLSLIFSSDIYSLFK